MQRLKGQTYVIAKAGKECDKSIRKLPQVLSHFRDLIIIRTKEFTLGLVH